jgi:hypothetical protein
MTGKSRSPIKDKPLRQAGQSLIEERERIFSGKVEPWMLMASFAIVLAILEWYSYFMPRRPLPWMMTAAALAAAGQARWLSATITDTTDRKVFVRPVVVFPGWFVDAAEGSQRQVWVMEPKGLPAFIEREPEVLSKEDIALVAKSISMHVRAQERERAGR